MENYDNNMEQQIHFLKRQIILYQCPSWAWDDINVNFVDTNTNSYNTWDIIHRIFMIPASPNGMLNIKEYNKEAFAKTIVIGDISVFELQSNDQVHITAIAKYSSEEEGCHAKYSQHQCDCQLNIETDAIGITVDEIKQQCEDILQIGMQSLLDHFYMHKFAEEILIPERLLIFARAIVSVIGEPCFMFKSKIVFPGTKEERMNKYIEVLDSL